MNTRLSRTAAAGALTLAMAGMSACGHVDAPEHPDHVAAAPHSGPSASSSSPAPTRDGKQTRHPHRGAAPAGVGWESAADEPFTLIAGDDGMRYLLGHGIVLAVPRTWQPYLEQGSVDGTTYDSTVVEPNAKSFAPASVMLAMGKPGQGVIYDQAVAAAKQQGSIDATFKVLDEGTLSVPGAPHASFLRTEFSRGFNDTNVTFEQLQVFLDMPTGEMSSVRFVTAKGKWQARMGDILHTLRVAEADAG